MKKSQINELFQKYAFSLNEKKKALEIAKTNQIAFKKQHKGIYDDLVNNDIRIEEMRKKLFDIKSNSIKETVYTHYDVPNTWKNKIGYQDNLLEIFSKDKSFVSYIGKGGGLNLKKKDIDNDLDSKSVFSKTSNNFFPKINDELNIDNLENKRRSSILRTESSLKLKFLKGKKEETEREILAILEEYKNAFPIKKEKNLINEINESRNNKLFEEKVNKTFTSSFFNPKTISSKSRKQRNKLTKNISNNPFYYLDNLPKKEKQLSFRQTIYTNFIPSKITSNSNLILNKVKKLNKKKLLQLEESKFGPFLHSNNEIFNKKVTINNPIIKKNLESINYYGPYYSYCPPCRNKNLEYYKNLEQGKAIELIHYIKKTKKGNTIIEADDKNNDNNSKQGKSILIPNDDIQSYISNDK